MISTLVHRTARQSRSYVRVLTTVLMLLGAVMATLLVATSADAQSVRPPAGASVPGGPDAAQPRINNNYDVELWRKIRRSESGTVSIPDKKAGRLVQSAGENWRTVRNGELSRYGGYALGGTLALLVLFFLIRGRIRIDHGWSGRTIERFSNLERMGHWLLATSFIILALTGLNMLYGREVVLPLLGKSNFALMTAAGKWLHNYVAFAFMAGLVLTFVMWVIHNVPSWRDIVWVLKGGGILMKGVHPPAWKFNAGQKILFWLVILGGVSISMSGLTMLFPFQSALFSKTFAILNGFGFHLPTNLTPIEEMQYATTWHAIIALALTCVIVAHIYIGTVGMEGAFDAMGSGEVDVNWAKEHHSLWADQVLSGCDGAGSSSATPPRPAPAE
jgi:formate dehydrogenase subunit gamma